jgi:PAS domain S-box-containing protein
MKSKKYMNKIKSKDQLAVLRHLADHCPDEVYVIDANGDFIYVNDKSCEALGYTRDELMGLSVMKVDPWYDHNEWPHHWREKSYTVTDIFETRHRRKDGTIFPVLIRSRFYNLDGIDFIIAFARDISEQLKLKDTVSELEKRMEIIFNGSDKPIMILDDKGNILSSNKAICDALGYGQDSMTGKRIDEFLDKESKEHFASIFPIVLKDDDYQCDVVFIGKTGEHVPVRCTPKVVVDEYEEIISVVLLQEIL